MQIQNRFKFKERKHCLLMETILPRLPSLISTQHDPYYFYILNDNNYHKELFHVIIICYQDKRASNTSIRKDARISHTTLCDEVHHGS
mmetsp:Transcript_4014/g.8936  ORF Transcript_4014/g.8936 Transcript_4014/m.8936 type:complete len:88 (-) Transcript_4014:2879-3142(-)